MPWTKTGSGLCDEGKHDECDGTAIRIDQDGTSRYRCGCHCHRRNDLAEAMNRQGQRAEASGRVNRKGWTDEQWIADADRLMNEEDGAVTSLVNGHVLALLRKIAELEAELEDRTQRVVVLHEAMMQAKAERDRLREALKKYGKHGVNCNWNSLNGNPDEGCTCGLDALLNNPNPQDSR